MSDIEDYAEAARREFRRERFEDIVRSAFARVLTRGETPREAAEAVAPPHAPSPFVEDVTARVEQLTVEFLCRAAERIDGRGSA